MINLVSVLLVFAMLGGAIAVMAVSLRGRGEAIVTALAGVQPARGSSTMTNEARRGGRSPVRTIAVRPTSLQPLRAAA